MINYNDYIGQPIWIHYLGNPNKSMILGTLKEVVIAIESEDAVEQLLVEYDNKVQRINTNELLQFFPKETYDDPDTEYYYVIFRYGKTSKSKEHIYMSYDRSIQPGDKVLVWKDWLYVGNVIRTGLYTKNSAPYPVDKTWLIESRVYDRIDFEKYPEAGAIIKEDNLYRDKYLNTQNDHRQFLSTGEQLYAWLRDENTEFLEQRNAFTTNAILSNISYELDWEWCESNQLDVFYRTVWACAYMAKHDCYDKFYFDKYLCLSLIYKHGDFDSYLLLPELDKPEIDKDVNLVDAYLKTL